MGVLEVCIMERMNVKPQIYDPAQFTTVNNLIASDILDDGDAPREILSKTSTNSRLVAPSDPTGEKSPK